MNYQKGIKMEESHIDEINKRLNELNFQDKIELFSGISLRAAAVLQKAFPGITLIEEVLKQKSGK